MNPIVTAAAVDSSTPNHNKQQKQTAKEVIAANVQTLIEQLEQGRSEALTSYLTAMGRFHNYSFGNILEIARQRAVTYCYTSLESIDTRVCSSSGTPDGRLVAVRRNRWASLDR